MARTFVHGDGSSGVWGIVKKTFNWEAVFLIPMNAPICRIFTTLVS